MPPPLVLVTGAAGMVGSEVCRRAPDGVTVTPLTRAEVELSDRAAVLDAFGSLRPSVVVHTAYGTAHLDRDVVRATGNVVDACLATGADLVHLSTDVVFDGEQGPYAEHDPPRPVHAYGRAKADAEADVQARLPGACVVRTSLVCWDDPLDPRSAAVVGPLRDGRPVTLFTDELRNPVRVDDLADALWALVTLTAAERAGTWHLVGAEAFSRYDLGVLLARWAGLDPAGITAGTSAAWTGPEPRPRDCRLSTARADAAGLTLRSVRSLFRPGSG